MFIKRRNSVQFTTRIGELLTDAGVVSPELINQSLPIASRSRLPLGRVLVMSGHLTEGDVTCALHVQQNIREGKTTRESARRILRLAHANRTTVEEALALLRWEEAHALPVSHIGKLLIAAELVNESTVIEMTARSARAGVSLGRALVAAGVIEEPDLTNALNLQILVRDRKITRIDAIRALNSTAAMGIGLAHAFEILSIPSPFDSSVKKMPLGELLQIAGIVTHHETIDALEISLENEKKLGQVLIYQLGIQENILEAALKLQDMIAEGTLSPMRAAEMLSLVSAIEAPLEAIIFEMERIKQVISFLGETGALEESAVKELASNCQDFEERKAQLLLQNKIVTPHMLRIGAMCLAMYRHGSTTDSEASVIVNYCLEYDVEPPEALHRLRQATQKAAQAPEPIFLTAAG